MKAGKMRPVLLASSLFVCIISTRASFAFHDGGIANCDGCHTMHNSSGNIAMTKTGLPPGTANPYLLQGSDQSSTCLICHAGSTPTDSYKIATNPVPAPGNSPRQLTPGGDFAYLQKSYNWVDSLGAAKSSPGGNHGHNITAADFLYFGIGSRFTAAPGGSYPTANLSCISCHDPHGRYRIMDAGGTTFATTGKPIGGSGSFGDLPTENLAVGPYRMLAGKFYQPASVQGNLSFVADPPAAVSPTSYNRSEDPSDTRVAYGRGVSEWCGNCHGQYRHRSVTQNSIVDSHPAGPATGGELRHGDVYLTYNQYVKTGDLTGTIATAYNSLVPFEEEISDLATLASRTTSTAGASGYDSVMCLTCHRAHASAWDNSTRWNTAQNVYLTVDGNYPGIDAPTQQGRQGEYATGKIMAEYQQAMYGRDPGKFAAFQRSLCNKCHENDSHKQ